MKNAVLAGALCGLSAMAVYCLYDVAVKYLARTYSPMQVLFCATLFFVPLILVQVVFVDRSGLRPTLPRWTAIRVLVTTLNGVLGVYAFAVLPLAQAYAVFFLMPLMISALAVPMLNEPMDLWRGLAILAGFAGVLIALNPGAATLGIGHLAAFGAAALGAFNYVILRKTGQRESSGVLLFYPAAAQLLAVGWMMPGLWQPMSSAHWGMVALMGLGVFIGGRLIIAGYKLAPAIVVAPMQYSQIFWAAILGWLIFAETINAQMIAGITLIIAAGIFILTRSAPAPRASDTPAT